ncbi:RNA polymerase sigma-70 factor (ECF subfamily) [Amycolatopsis sulphurea]|uniref:RNA polymerase sigma factor n=1 Tax=Amycolatopsis sulphurea TaxID=76022 RepID=A0A2A9FIF0_9PSEU|nr:sigma-70 family RNA polymerase sigma factor [Amycolatopsis sulphurea]PFG50928.1 RNA polymerase sigma-70 factor (ECF subfamily) [Amycolatopsis sulphurea]
MRVSIGRGSDDERITALALAGGRGDRAALERWVRETQADVWRFLAHRTSPAEADDLTQETYLRAFGSLPRFAARSSSRTWLLSIARRVVVDRIRARSARPRESATADWQHAAEEQSARSRAAGFEDLIELGLLLAGLDDDRREALVLTQFLGLSYAEAAEVSGCPVGTVRSRVSRAREDLLRAQEETDSAM